MGTTTQQQTSCTFHSHQIVCGTNYFLPRATAVGTKSQPGSDVRNSCLLSITYHGRPYPNPPAPNVCDVLLPEFFPLCHASVCGLLIACFLIFSGSILVLFDLRRPREACAYLPKGSLVSYTHSQIIPLPSTEFCRIISSWRLFYMFHHEYLQTDCCRDGIHTVQQEHVPSYILQRTCFNIQFIVRFGDALSLQ